MKKLSLILAFLAFSLPAFAQIIPPPGGGSPISQLPSGGSPQPTDLVPISRCNHAGCNYSLPLSQIMGPIGANGTYLQSNGSSVSYAPSIGDVLDTIIMLPGDVHAPGFYTTIVLNKTVDQITTVFAPATPRSGERFRVKDGNGHSITFPITIDGNGNLIDGSTTLILNNGYEAVELVYNGTQWNLVSAYSASAIPPGTNFLTDESGNKLTDELGNRLVVD